MGVEMDINRDTDGLFAAQIRSSHGSESTSSRSRMINWRSQGQGRNASHRETLIGLLVLQTHLTRGVLGHGRLMEPPNRSSLWRLKEFDALQPEKNYDDNQLWCGGMGSQYNLSGGKCGSCGDEYAKSRPRENENGGKYGRGIITRTYKTGQVIQIGVELTVNHLGYFVFSLCPIQLIPGGTLTFEEEECFDMNPLSLADGSGHKFMINSNDTGYYKTFVRLPNDLKCKLCVIRWHYRTGNRWNYVNNQTGALGIGDQEIFRGCSDVSIGYSTEMNLTTPAPGTTMTSTLRSTTTVPTVSQNPTSAVKPSPGRPHSFPTQRPPTVVLPASAPTTESGAEVASSTDSPATSNKHSHPVMRPPLSGGTKTMPILLSTLIDSTSKQLIVKEC